MLNKERVALKSAADWLHFISTADIGRLTQYRTSSVDVIFRILRGSPIHRAFSARRDWEFLPGPNSPGSNLVCASRLNAETAFSSAKSPSKVPAVRDGPPYLQNKERPSLGTLFDNLLGNGQHRQLPAK
jgi:hypothetical protein